MKTINKKPTAHQKALKQMPDDIIMIEAATRMGTSLSTLIKPQSPSQMRIDLETWKRASLYARNVDFPNRNPLYDVYDNIRIDLNFSSLLDKRILKLQQSKFVVKDDKGSIDKDATAFFKTSWFEDFLKEIMEAKYEGFRLLEFINFNPDGTIKSIEAVNKYHVKPELDIVTVNPHDQFGTNFRNGLYSNYYLPIGKPKDLGLLFKTGPVLLAIKYAIAQWNEYNEKEGIPFRTVTSPNNDDKRRKQLAVIMQNMGSAGWAVLNEGEKVELLLKSGTNSTDCFEKLIRLLDARVANYVIGQSQTANSADNKGTYGSMKVLAEITDDIHEADLTHALAIITEQLIPMMIKFGYKLQNRKFHWDKSIELGVSELIDYVAKLDTAGYEADADYVTEKTGIPVKRKIVTTPPPSGEKKK